MTQGDWDERVALDAMDSNAIRRFVQRCGGLEAVIGYEPALSPGSWVALVGGSRRQVIVLPSRYAAPEPGPEPLLAWLEPGGVTSVQLGWTGPEQSPRWHRPDEVSAIAARALDHRPGSQLVLGRVRPWEERPH